jgi:hypothetical protein
MGSLAPQAAHWNAAKTSGTCSDIVCFPDLSREIAQSGLVIAETAQPKT